MSADSHADDVYYGKKRRTLLTGFDTYTRWEDEVQTNLRTEDLWKFVDPDPNADKPEAGNTAAA